MQEKKASSRLWKIRLPATLLLRSPSGPAPDSSCAPQLAQLDHIAGKWGDKRKMALDKILERPSKYQKAHGHKADSNKENGITAAD